jgi:hypothetical protein
MEFHSRFIRFVSLHERKETKRKRKRERCFGQRFCALCFGVFVDRKRYFYDDDDEFSTKKIKRKRKEKCKRQKCRCARGGDGER